jgi:AcrR family transcriptional regulator
LSDDSAIVAAVSVQARQRLPAAERRGLIIAAALAEFARAGYDSASMGRIASAAGVTRTVLYDHFPSKRALFAAVLSQQAATLLDHLRATITARAPMRERIEATIDAYFAFAESEPEAFALLYPDRPPLAEEVAAEHRRWRAESNRLLAELLAPDARRAGLEPSSHVAQIVFALDQAALREAVRWWRAHPHVTRAQLVEGTMAALWSGLGGYERGGGEGRRAPGRRAPD